MREHYRKTPEEIAEISRQIAGHLTERSVRPAYCPEKIQEAISVSLSHRTPLRCRLVLCPNWQVDKKGRSIAEIPFTINQNRLQILNPSMRIVPLLTEEIPGLVAYLNRNTLNVEFLVVIADILSPGWVYDPKGAKETLKQNRKAVKVLLMSSNQGKEIFNDKQRAALKVRSQLQLATNTPEYEKKLIAYQVETLTDGTPMNRWYLEVLKRLQEMGEYSDKRTDIAGLWKIWERARFLTALYALDGEVIESDFAKVGFPISDSECGYLALGTVSTPHGDIIAEGWNLRRDYPIGVVSPFNNAMKHSWTESRAPSVQF